MSTPEKLPDLTEAGGPFAGTVTPYQASEKTREMDPATVAERGPGRFADAAVSARDFAALDIPKPRSLFGDGVLAAGGLAILYAIPGAGKTWVLLSCARSMVRGETWLGMSTAPEGARVGVVQLELGAHSMQSRLRTLGIGTHERDGALSILCRPMLRGAVDFFRQPEHLADLRGWIAAERLDVVMLDALSRCHTANENSGEELGAVLAGLDAIRHETGTAILLVHHEPKQRADQRADDHLAALRGSSRLQSDPTLLMRVCASGGLRSLVFVKVSEARKPDDVFFRLADDGQPVVTKAPASIRDENRERVLRAILEAGRPLTRAEVQEASRLGRSAAAGHLRALADEGRIAASGENRDAKYAPPTVQQSEPSTPLLLDGQPSMFTNDLDDCVSEPSASGRKQPSEPSTPSALKGRNGWTDGRSVPDGSARDGGAMFQSPNSANSSGGDPCPICGDELLVWTDGAACHQCHRLYGPNLTEPADA